MERERAQCCAQSTISARLVSLTGSSCYPAVRGPFFRPGPLTKDSWSARKSAIREAKKWRGDLRSMGRTQITWKTLTCMVRTPNTPDSLEREALEDVMAT